MAASLVVFFFLVFCCLYFLWSRRKMYAFCLKMPGPFGLPFIGITHKLFNNANILYVLPKFTTEYKAKTYATWLGMKPGVYVMDPETAELVLNSPDCINKSFVYSAISDLGGDGIVTSKSPKWNRHRKLLNACFKHKVLVSFIPGFNKTANELCKKLDQYVDRGEVNIKELIFHEGLKSAIGTIFGVNLEKEDYNNTILDSWLGSTAIIIERATKPWLLSSSIFPLTNLFKTFSDLKTNIDNFIQGMVRRRIEFFENQRPKELNSPENSENVEKPRLNILDQSVKIYQNNKFTFVDLVAETGTIAFAAFETTNMATYSTLLFLAMHPDYQDKLYEEIVTVFPDEKFDIEYEDFKNLVYLDMCINETLRLAPSVPLVGRETTNDVPLSKDKIIPKGFQIFIDIFNIQRDEDIWGPDAKTFNPDHFLPSNLEGKHKYAFMPFSKGVRNCIGWHYAGIALRVTLVKILRKYRLSTKFSYADLRFTQSLTLGYEKVPLLEMQKR